MKHLTTCTISTPIGELFAAASEEALSILEFSDRGNLESRLQRWWQQANITFISGTNSILEKLSEELKRYFDGELKTFSIPLVFNGSEFQKKVWKQLVDIPYGVTYSYKELSEQLGDQNAVRAVARANGENAIAIIVPCHRVIGADGSLTGYSGGIERKRYLLNLERKNRSF